MRSRMNSGIQVSECGMSSYKKSSRNVSESDASDEIQNIASNLSQEQQTGPNEEEYKVEINYEQARLANSQIADSDLRDDWLEEKTEFVLTNFGQDEIILREFMFHCDGLFSVLMNSKPQKIQEVQDILSGKHSIGCM